MTHDFKHSGRYKKKDICEGAIDDYIREITDFIISTSPDKQELQNMKIRLCKKHGVKKIPTDIEILLRTDESLISKVVSNLQTKPGRTNSGVAVVAIMSYPFPCPHGECTMCPSMTDQDVPQSYTGREPASMRGIRNSFDPFLQVFNRLEQYIATGHDPCKVELIIMGGTFLSFDDEYKEEFIKGAYCAMNVFSEMFYPEEKHHVLDIARFREFFELPGDIRDEAREKRIQQKVLALRQDGDLESFQSINERSAVRCVGLTIETRPDHGMLKHGNEMLRYGCTRVELGIQSVYDDVLSKIDRGHTVQDSIDSTRILKDLGFKINYHMMPGLPGVSVEKDIAALNEIVDNPDFRPDMLKIYPCMVMKHSKLYHEWKAGNFVPMDARTAINVIREFKKHVPEYMRIMRVQRDIPTYAREAGVEFTNLRQMIEQSGHGCRCIRCREAGRVFKKTGKRPKDITIVVREYDASSGREFFISAEDVSMDVLVGFCRMRFPSQALRKEIAGKTSVIRELHVYGDIALLGTKGEFQHSGWGKKLIQKAEDIAKKHGMDNMLVISGIGVREYYRKLGYERCGPYMGKRI